MTEDRVPELSAFFPAYNEKDNLSRMVQSLREALPNVADRYEIVVVDDGSRDGTAELADQLAVKFPEVHAVHHPRNRGYGAAVRSGISACRYGLIFFTDGDCQFDVREVKSLIPHASQYDIVTGYRANRRDPWIRRLYARGWNCLVRLLTGVRVRDLNCAFKLFKADVVKGVELTTTGATINAEILALALKRGRSIFEVPVTHYPRTAGQQTGGNPWVILRAFKELLLFKLRF